MSVSTAVYAADELVFSSPDVRQAISEAMIDNNRIVRCIKYEGCEYVSRLADLVSHLSTRGVMAVNKSIGIFRFRRVRFIFFHEYFVFVRIYKRLGFLEVGLNVFRKMPDPPRRFLLPVKSI
jgi:hypothetical protein